MRANPRSQRYLRLKDCKRKRKQQRRLQPSQSVRHAQILQAESVSAERELQGKWHRLFNANR